MTAPTFADYVGAGWSLVPVPSGQKGPRRTGWNLQKNCITDPVQAGHLEGAGLAHAYSGTCALDIDDMAAAQAYLKGYGLDLEALLGAPDAVKIVSGVANRGKLIYALAEPLPSCRLADGAFELRCSTRNGTTVQDVLPPSIHPGTKQPYRWEYDDLIADWRHPPSIPAALLELWQGAVNIPNEGTNIPDRGNSAPELPEMPEILPGGNSSTLTTDAQAMLDQQDPDCGYDTWIRIGMALHHELGDTGLALWDRWSAKGSKYAGRADLASHWQSFGRGKLANPVTLDFIRAMTVASPDEFDDLTLAEDGDVFAAFSPDKPSEKTRKAFEFRPATAVADDPAPEWIIKGLLPRAELAMVYGQSGAGKSFVVLDMALAIARGEPWFGHETHAGTVAWVAAEAAGSMRNRLRAYAFAQGLDAPDNLQICGQTPDLSDLKHDMPALAKSAAALKPALVVVDTLAAASGGANENSGEDMNKVMEGCRVLHRATGATVLLVHHSGKDTSKGARGWSGIRAAVDTEIEIRDCQNASRLRIMEVTKQRDAEDGLQMPFRLESVELEIGGESSAIVVPVDDMPEVERTGRVQKLGAKQQMVLQVFDDLRGLDGTDGVDLAEIMDGCMRRSLPPIGGARDNRKRDVQRALDTLVARNFLRVEGDSVVEGGGHDDE